MANSKFFPPCHRVCFGGAHGPDSWHGSLKFSFTFILSKYSNPPFRRAPQAHAAYSGSPAASRAPQSTQKPSEVMLERKAVSFFSLSVYCFPSGEFFFFYLKVPKMKCCYPLPERLWSTPKAREQHSERTAEPQRQQRTDVHCPFSVLSLSHQNHKEATHIT